MNSGLPIPSGRRATLTLLLTVTLFTASGCHAKSPAPQSVLDQLEAFVENDGRAAPSEDIFSMPGGVVSTEPPRDTVKVTSVKYRSTMPPLTKEIGGIPKGTVMHYYLATSTRTRPDGSTTNERRLFYVYPDALSQWRFFENTGASLRLNGNE